MKIYVFKWSGGQEDWVFAPTMKDAKEFYLKFTGCGDLSSCEVQIVSKKEWKTHFILDINEAEPDPEEVEYNEEDYSCGYKIEETFADYAKSNTTTDLIATTEF
jgi:hypothetical protein